MTMDRFKSDLQFAFRSAFSGRHRLVSFLAVLALGVGIGINTAVFSVVDTLLLRPLPYPDARQLTIVTEYSRHGPRVLGAGADDGVSYLNLEDMAARTRAFQRLALYRFDLFNLRGPDGAEAVLGSRVGNGLLELLGVDTGPDPIRPAVGRIFHDVRPGGPDEQTAVLTYILWKRSFGGRPSVVGQTLIVDGRPRTVIGVLPERFEFPFSVPVGANVTTRTPEILVPLGEEPAVHTRYARNYFAFGRLKDGADVLTGQSDLERIARELAAEYPADDRDLGIRATDMQQHTSGHLRPALLVIAAAMAVVLLIACVNVANLLLARGAARGRELAVRSALGASRRQVVRQLLTESGVLALMGVALGLVLARWGLEALLAAAPANLDRISEVSLDLRALSFAVLLGGLTTVLVGIYPALALSAAPGSVLGGESTRGATAGRGSLMVRRGLVVVEVALSLVMVIAATLLIRSYRAIERVDGGFDMANTLSLLVSLSADKYRADSARIQFFRLAETRLDAVPGVVGSAAISVPPLAALGNTGTVVPEGAPTGPDTRWPEAALRQVSSSYFDVAGIRRLDGRLFTLGDSAGRPDVAIVTKGLAARLFQDGSPLGRRVNVWGRTREIVGVINDVREFGLDADAPPGIYVPVAQDPFAAGGIIVRTTGDPRRAIEPVRRAIAAVDPDLATLSARSLRETLEASLAQRRFTMRLLATFAAAALLLAAIGLYGVLSYLVSQRDREIGIRMALGASERTVVGAVVRDGVTLALAGVGAGLLGAVASGGLLRGLLFGVSALDPVTFVAIPALLLGVAVVATLLPAWRAARVDPVEVLRRE